MKNKTGGIILAAVSSLTFGFVPFFSVTLMDAGFSPFEVLAYRWGVATIVRSPKVPGSRCWPSVFSVPLQPSAC